MVRAIFKPDLPLCLLHPRKLHFIMYSFMQYTSFYAISGCSCTAVRPWLFAMNRFQFASSVLSWGNACIPLLLHSCQAKRTWLHGQGYLQARPAALSFASEEITFHYIFIYAVHFVLRNFRMFLHRCTAMAFWHARGQVTVLCDKQHYHVTN